MEVRFLKWVQSFYKGVMNFGLCISIVMKLEIFPIYIPKVSYQDMYYLIGNKKHITQMIVKIDMSKNQYELLNLVT